MRLVNSTLLRPHYSNAPLTLRLWLDPVGHIAPPLAPQSRFDGTGMRQRRHRQPQSMRDDRIHLLPPQVVMTKIDHAAVIPNQAIHSMAVEPLVLHMKRTGARSLGQPELFLELVHPGLHRQQRRQLPRRINMHVIKRPPRAAVRSAFDHLLNLID